MRAPWCTIFFYSCSSVFRALCWEEIVSSHILKLKEGELDLHLRNAHESTYNNTPATAKKSSQKLVTHMQILKMKLIKYQNLSIQMMMKIAVVLLLRWYNVNNILLCYIFFSNVLVCKHMKLFKIWHWISVIYIRRAMCLMSAFTVNYVGVWEFECKYLHLFTSRREESSLIVETVLRHLYLVSRILPD